MSQRIINLVDIIVSDAFVLPPLVRAKPERAPVPAGVQTGVKHDRGVRFREVTPGWWSYEIRRKHGTTFGGPLKGLPAAMERATRVQLALVEKKIAV